MLRSANRNRIARYSTHCKYMAMGIKANSNETITENPLPMQLSKDKCFLLLIPNERNAL